MSFGNLPFSNPPHPLPKLMGWLHSLYFFSNHWQLGPSMVLRVSALLCLA